MRQKPSRDSSSHWWLTELPVAQRRAFRRVAESSVIQSSFRSIFSEGHVCIDSCSVTLSYVLIDIP